MDAAERQRGVSAAELRGRLYRSFKKKGLLDSLKTQLRNQLIVELRRDSLPRTGSEPRASLSLLTSNSLIIQHLQSCGYHYTLSVFQPESGLHGNQVLSVKEIVDVLNIRRQSVVDSHLDSESQSEHSGLLVNLISEVLHCRLHSELQDAATQTSDAPDHRQSLVQKIQMIDEEYDGRRMMGNPWEAVEVKLAEFRRQMEEQMQVELRSQSQRFQEEEVTRIQMEEQEKCRVELQETRRQLERNYELKVEALMSREKNAIERLQRQQEVEEKELYVQRQVLLKDIEAVRHRESELRLREEDFKKWCEKQVEVMKSSEEQLKVRELNVRRMEEVYEQRLSTEIMKQQLELKQDYSRRSKTLVQREQKNEEETERIHRETAALHVEREENHRVRTDLNHTQVALASAQVEVRELKQQNVVLEEKLKRWSDHAAEHLQLQTELFSLRKQLQRLEEENLLLHQEVNKPSEKVLKLRAELKQVQTGRSLEQREFLQQKQLLQTRFHQEVERCAEVERQLQQCEDRSRWMTVHMEEIKQQLQHTQQALENEVLRNPKPAVVDFHVPHGTAPPDLSPEGYPDEPCDPRGTSQRHGTLWSDASGTVSAAFARIQELGKEAESLEEVYRSYRRKAGVTQTVYKGLAPPPHTSANLRTVSGLTSTHREPTVLSAEPAPPQEPAGCVTPPTVGSPPLRRLSSTPGSTCKGGGSVWDHGSGSTPNLTPQRDLSPILAVDPDDHAHHSPPHSAPQPSCSSPDLQQISISPQEVSPEPPPISIQDLRLHPPRTGEAVSVVGGEPQERRQEEAGQSSSGGKEEEPEGWRLKEDGSGTERQEALDRDNQELQRLQQEVKEALSEPAEEKPEETDGDTAGAELEDGGGGGQDDPLHKYMMMVMQDRTPEDQQKWRTDLSEVLSSEAEGLSHKEDSVTAASHQELEDEFW